MKKILYILLASLAVVGCYKNDLKNTDYPDKGSVSLNLDWSNLHTGESAPTAFELYVGEDKYTIIEPEATMILEPQAQQEFLMYNNPMGMSIIDGIAYLDSATRAAADLEPQPQSLYYDSAVADIVADQRLTVPLTPKRGNAMLTLKLGYEQSEAQNIQEITATLSGIAATRNLRTDAISDEVTLTHYPDFGTASPLVLEFNLFGTIGTEQVLTLTYTTTDGQTRVVSSNLSSQLANFNANMEALTLTGDMNLPSGLEVEGDIEGWDDKNENGGTAE